MRFRRFLPSSKLTQDLLIKRFVLIGFLSLSLQIILTISFFKHLPLTLPIFYSQPWGITQLAKKPTLWLFSLLTTIVFILNLILAHFLFAREKILAEVLIVAAAVFAFLILFTQIKIILLFW